MLLYCHDLCFIERPQAMTLNPSELFPDIDLYLVIKSYVLSILSIPTVRTLAGLALIVILVIVIAVGLVSFFFPKMNLSIGDFLNAFREE